MSQTVGASTEKAMDGEKTAGNPSASAERLNLEAKKVRRDRSRSREKGRSRSKSKKHRHRDHKDKNKDKKHKRSRTPKHHRDYREYRDHHRKDYQPSKLVEKQQQKQQKERKTKDGQVLQPTQIPMPPMEIPMPELAPAERRRRERSRSPLGYYRRNQTNNEGEFWDSFSWIPRINYIPSVSSSALVNTKKMRRFMITGVPYEVGITEDDLRELITRYMKENYLKDQMNNCPVVNMEINQNDRNVAVQLSSVEETCRICKLDKIQLLKGIPNGIIRLGDSCYGNNVVTQAQTAAQAQAAAFAAINVLQNKKTNFNIEAAFGRGPKSSPIIRVTNAVTTYMASHLTSEQWTEYHEDLLEGLSSFGKILHNWFVRKEERDICADPGNLFVEYESAEISERAVAEMQGRIFDQRSIQIYYIPRDMYYKNFKKGVFPPKIQPKAEMKAEVKGETKGEVAEMKGEVKGEMRMPDLPR